MLFEHIHNILTGLTSNVCPARMDQKIETPFIVHTKAGTDPTRNKDGDSNVDYVDYRVASFGETMAEASLLGDQVRDLLKNYKGTLYGSRIIVMTLIDEVEDFDFDSGFYFSAQTYRIVERDLT